MEFDYPVIKFFLTKQIVVNSISRGPPSWNLIFFHPGKSWKFKCQTVYELWFTNTSLKFSCLETKQSFPVS